MSKLRLLIKRPGRANTWLPVMVDSSEIIGNCIPALVDHLGFPRQDHLGRALTYSLRPLSGRQPLYNTMPFAEAHLLPETRLILEVEDSNAATRPLGRAMPGSGSIRIPKAQPSLPSSRQIMSRRTFIVGGVLTGCSVGGLFAGVVTAFATKGALPVAMPLRTPIAQHKPGSLQPNLVFSGHQQTVRALAWSPDGNMIASGSDDGWLLVWTTDGQVLQQIPHPAGIAALAWEPSGKLLASGSGASVHFFDARTAAPLVPARHVHTGQVTSLAWSNAERHPLISGSLDRRAIVWNTHTFEQQAIFTRHTAAINALSCSTDGATVASASQGGVVRVWRVDTLTELHGYYQDAPISLEAIAFAPIGTQLAAGGNDGLVRLWNNGFVCQQSAISDQGTLCLDIPSRFHAHTAAIRGISWSPDTHDLATGGEDGTLAIWDVTPGRIPALVASTTYADPIAAITWSPVQAQVAVASGKIVTIWNIQR